MANMQRTNVQWMDRNFLRNNRKNRLFLPIIQTFAGLAQLVEHPPCKR